MNIKIKYNDYPLQEIAEAAEKLVLQGLNVYQKWTCKHCGSRQTMEEANKFFTSGKCEECKKLTKIKKCNYLVYAKGPEATEALMKDLFKDPKSKG